MILTLLLFSTIWTAAFTDQLQSSVLSEDKMKDKSAESIMATVVLISTPMPSGIQLTTSTFSSSRSSRQHTTKPTALVDTSQVQTKPSSLSFEGHSTDIASYSTTLVNNKQSTVYASPSPHPTLSPILELATSTTCLTCLTSMEDIAPTSTHEYMTSVQLVTTGSAGNISPSTSTVNGSVTMESKTNPIMSIIPTMSSLVTMERKTSPALSISSTVNDLATMESKTNPFQSTSPTPTVTMENKPTSITPTVNDPATTESKTGPETSATLVTEYPATTEGSTEGGSSLGKTLAAVPLWVWVIVVVALVVLTSCCVIVCTVCLCVRRNRKKAAVAARNTRQARGESGCNLMDSNPGSANNTVDDLYTQSKEFKESQKSVSRWDSLRMSWSRRSSRRRFSTFKPQQYQQENKKDNRKSVPGTKPKPKRKSLQVQEPSSTERYVDHVLNNTSVPSSTGYNGIASNYPRPNSIAQHPGYGTDLSPGMDVVGQTSEPYHTREQQQPWQNPPPDSSTGMPSRRYSMPYFIHQQQQQQQQQATGPTAVPYPPVHQPPTRQASEPHLAGQPSWQTHTNEQQQPPYAAWQSNTNEQHQPSWRSEAHQLRQGLDPNSCPPVQSSSQEPYSPPAAVQRPWLSQEPETQDIPSTFQRPWHSQSQQPTSPLQPPTSSMQQPPPPPPPPPPAHTSEPRTNVQQTWHSQESGLSRQRYNQSFVNPNYEVRYPLADAESGYYNPNFEMKGLHVGSQTSNSELSPSQGFQTTKFLIENSLKAQTTL